jgi:retinol dehydrogenase 14
MSAQAMAGKVCLVTGATSGIGRETARGLAAQGAAVIVAGRDRRRCEQTAAALRRAYPAADVSVLVADLSSQAEVRRLADDFARQHERLDVLVNNAGAQFRARHESADGIELTFALNHLAYFLLTLRLLDVLTESAPARIVNVASNAHYSATLDFDDLELRRGYDGSRAYRQSKLANVMFTYELARRLEGTGVTANALHPGVVATDFGAKDEGLRSLLRKLVRPAVRLALGRRTITPWEGAQTSLYLAASPEVAGVTGQYFDNKAAVRSSDASYDVAEQRRLWDFSAAMTGLE